MLLTDKETERQVGQERVDSLQRLVKEQEQKINSMQVTIDRQALSLHKQEEGQQELSTKMQVWELRIRTETNRISHSEKSA